jgi:predicted Rossmann-fold nucleotide-binding protein
VNAVPVPPRFSQEVYDPFFGQNDLHEIETYEEFILKTKDIAPSHLFLDGWVFQGVDFSKESTERWNYYSLKGASFFGCTFPDGVTHRDIRDRGGHLWREPSNMPFKAFRPFMYTQKEIIDHDAVINDHYNKHRDIATKLAQSIHDFSMVDALHDYLEGKTPVGFMGGHKTPRSSPEYKATVRLARRVTQAGFLVVTGGGAGSMEAANLGAYLANKTDVQVEEALKIIEAGNEGFEGVEWLNPTPADNVVKALGAVTFMPSLGIPTFRYNQEPPNRFATYHAKFFQNALREDGLLAICTGGIIYVKGGPGTRQEIFQAACHNSEIRDERETRPMVFTDVSYWKTTGVLDVLEKTSKDLPFYKLLLCSDNMEEVVAHLVSHAKAKNFPLIADLLKLEEKFWEK